MGYIRLYLILSMLMFSFCAKAQSDTALQTSQQFQKKYLSVVSDKAEDIDKKLSRQTIRALKKFERQEARLQRKVANKDSAAAKDLFACSGQKLQQLQTDFTNMPDKAINKLNGEYNAYLDTLQSTLKFLQQKGSKITGKANELTGATSKINVLEGKLQKADEIKKYLSERRALLKERLENMGFAKQITKLEKTAFYYKQYVAEYKAMLKDKKKLEQKAMNILYSSSMFKKFVSEHSFLAGLFKIPGANTAGTAALPTLAGIQTRANVQELMQNAVGGVGGPNAIAQVKQQIQNGQAELSKLKDRISQSGSADGEIPSFKVNSQKTKSFLSRIEYGGNIQFGKASNFLPGTSDIAVTLGYKLNSRSSCGVGASYKLGLGTGWNNIKLSNQGVGIRSYIECKLKGKFYLSGGYEQNYYSSFSGIAQLRNYASWQSSGLVGISKKVQVKGKKSASVQLLYDFLHEQHVPVTQPLIFRTGFTFK